MIVGVDSPAHYPKAQGELHEKPESMLDSVAVRFEMRSQKKGYLDDRQV
jgi:hypothetical protein